MQQLTLPLTRKVGTRKDILEEAIKITNGERDVQYGGPEDLFKAIASLWSAYLGVSLNAADVACLMSLMKIARIQANPTKRDSWVDLAGYAACGAESVHVE